MKGQRKGLEVQPKGVKVKKKKNKIIYIINEQKERQRKRPLLQYLTGRAGVSNAVHMHKKKYIVYIHIKYLTLFYRNVPMKPNQA